VGDHYAMRELEPSHVGARKLSGTSFGTNALSFGRQAGRGKNFAEIGTVPSLYQGFFRRYVFCRPASSTFP
jgi:hypothetical protein